jgi:hypothetical protein
MNTWCLRTGFKALIKWSVNNKRLNWNLHIFSIIASLVILHVNTKRRQSSSEFHSQAKAFVVHSTIISHMAKEQPQLHKCGVGGMTTLPDFHKTAKVWLWPFAFQKNLRRETQVIPHVSKDFQLWPVHILQAGRQKLKRTELCTQCQLNSVAGYRKKKKKSTNYTWREERKMQWANVPSWHLPFDAKEEMALFQNFSIIMVSAASWTHL